ncbi:MAG: RND family transporter, partial [Nitrospiria bacterium]
MKTPQSLTERFFDRTVLAHPRIVLAAILILIAFLAYQAKNFQLDASADTLILEDDQDLRNTRTMIDRYGEQDFVVITYAPKGDLFSD